MSPLATLAIARTTAKDGLRAPVTGVVLSVGLALALVSPQLAIFTLGQAQGFVLDLGTSTALLAALFLAATAGALGTAERVQDGTALLVLTKSVSSLEYALGVWLGTAALLLISGWLLGLAVLHATVPAARGSGLVDLLGLGLALAAGVRASRGGRGFQPAFLLVLAITGPGVLLGRVALAGVPPLLGVAVAGSALAVLAGLAYAGLGVLLGVRLPPALAASATLGAAALGATARSVGGGGGAGAKVLGGLLLLVPDLSLFSCGDAAYLGGRGVSLAFVGGVSLWALCYAAGTVALAAFFLGRRELG